MILKNSSTFSRWQFYCETPDGDELKLPIDSTYAKNQSHLNEIVLAQFEQFGHDYKAQIEITASRLNLGYTTYVHKSIEHQICLREDDGMCWEDGFGDDIHSFFKGVDSFVDKAPKAIKVLGQAVTKVMTKMATGKSQPAFKGCATCGGTKTFSVGKNALGRAGAVNNFVPTTLRGTRH